MASSEYLSFDREPPPPGRKTPIVVVRSKRTGTRLGKIAWFARWRQFCFYPERDTIFNAGCMADIQAVIAELKEERRAAAAAEIVERLP